MEALRGAFMLSSTSSHDSHASHQHSTTSRQADTESMDDGEKSTLLREELDTVMTKLQMIDGFTSTCINDGKERLRDLKGDYHMKDRKSLTELHEQLKARDERIDALASACDKYREMDRSKFDQICRLEDIINTNESLASERIFLKNEISSLKEKLQSLQTSVTDSFVLEKLNLAYQDLIAIYDLRADIEVILEEFHRDIINPTLHKNIVRLVRQKELALHSKIANK